MYEVAHGLALVNWRRGCQALLALHTQPAISQSLLIVAARPRGELLLADSACEASAMGLHVQHLDSMSVKKAPLRRCRRCSCRASAA